MRLPILFLEDDQELITIYEEFLLEKGYSSIIIREGCEGFDQAIIEEIPTLLTLKTAKQITNKINPDQPPVIIITKSKQNKMRVSEKFNLKPAIETSEVFSELKRLIG